MQKRIENIQGLRGIAILLVIVLHLMAMDKKYGHGDRILSDFLILGASGVDLFFVISGFVIVTVTRGLFKSPLSAIRFYYNRLSRIFPLYWVYSLIVLAIYVVRPGLVNALEEDRVHILASFFLLPQDLKPLLAVGWALVHVIYFYCVFAIFMMASEKRLTTFLMLWLLFIILGGLLYDFNILTNPTPTIKLITHPLTAEFIAGCLVAKLIHQGIKSHGVTAIILGTVLLLTGYGLYYFAVPGTAPKEWLRVAIFGVPCIMIVYGAVAIESSRGILLPRFICFLGDASYSTYLSHAIVLPAIGKLWGMLSVPGKFDNILIIVTMTVVALCVGIGSYLTIERLLSSIFQRAGMVLFNFHQPSLQKLLPKI
jgi:peptidoglycan/LPS O-acetylase OafA/YrhL